MGTERDKLKYELSADSSKYIRAYDKADKSTMKLDKSVTSLGGNLGKYGLAGAATLAAAAVAALGAATIDGVKSSAEWERKLLRTEYLIKATGNAAGLSKTELSNFAKSMDLKTLADRDEVMQAINIMQTFKSVRGEVFKDAIRLAQDLSEVIGVDLRSQAVQLGKALEDPITGLTSLRRVGVSFTESQKELIKSLYESGHAAESQKEILKVLEGQVGGAAEGAAGGLSGKMDLLNFKWREFKENLAGATGATNLANRAIGALISTLDSMNKKLAPSTEKLIQDEIDLLQSFGMKTVVWFGGNSEVVNEKIKKRIKTLENSLEALKNPIGDTYLDYDKLNETVNTGTKNTAAAAKAAKELEQQISALDKAIAASNANPWDPIGYDIDMGGIDPVAEAIAKIEQERNNRAIQTARNIAIQNGMPDTYEDQGDPLAGLEDDFDRMIQLSQRTAEAMEQNFSDFFFDVAMNKFDSLSDYLNALTQSIVRAGADIGGQAMKEFIFGAQATTQHSGGPAGVGPKRTVSAASFIGAPKLHDGLRPDEFRAILQKGETVIPKGESSKVDVFINPVNESGSPLDVQPRIIQKSPSKLVVDMVIKEKFTSRNSRQILGGI